MKVTQHHIDVAATALNHVHDNLVARGERGDLDNNRLVACLMLLLVNKTTAEYGAEEMDHLTILNEDKERLDELFQNAHLWRTLGVVIGDHIEKDERAEKENRKA